MKISNSWLKEYIKIDLDAEKIGAILTEIGLELEGIQKYESVKGSLEGIVVGKVLTCEKHPDADKLKVTTVDIGASEPLNIVCGAPNVTEGQLVAVATVGTRLYDKNGAEFVINKTKIRGQVSEGMICAEDEIGLGNSHDGIMVLQDTHEIGKPLSFYFNLFQDKVYEIGLTPNRADAMSHYGVARDLYARLASITQASEFEKITTLNLETDKETEFSILVEDQEQCPRFLGAIIKNVKVAASPLWLQNRLKAIEINPINNIVDITNYILHGLGQPLHAFDADKISGKKIRVGHCENGTKFRTLDGIERTLNGTEIMIKDGNNNPLSIAGVFGGEGSGISENTNTIFLESAYFDPVTIRKAAKYHNLNTDASFRFERGIDPNNCRTAISHAVQLILDITEGELAGEILENYPNLIKPTYVLLRYSRLDMISGIKIHREKVKEILKYLEIDILNEINDTLELSVPTYRNDVTREVDVIEEILRIYGFNKIVNPDKISFTPVKLSFDGQDTLENDWARMLQPFGFHEVINNSLCALENPKDAVELLNPLSNELMYMRQDLLGGILENASYNINRKNPNIKFFEFGKSYFKKRNYEERKQLALLVSGRDQEENWLEPKKQTNFFYLKSYVQLLLDKLNLEYEEKPCQDQRFSESLEIFSEGQTIAKLGKVSDVLLKKNDIEQETFFAEIEIETCHQLRSEKTMLFKQIPKFNAIRRDLSLLLDKEISYMDLYNAAKKNAPSELIGVNLFDVYEGKNLPAGKKSYALSFELLNKEKTMEEAEISSIMNGLIAKFEKEFKAELRN